MAAAPKVKQTLRQEPARFRPRTLPHSAVVSSYFPQLVASLDVSAAQPPLIAQTLKTCTPFPSNHGGAPLCSEPSPQLPKAYQQGWD